MLDAYVVDSSVVIRWYVDQVGHEHARRVQDAFLSGMTRLEAPDVIRWEVGNVLRAKGVATGRLTEDDLVGALTDLDDLGVVVHETSVSRLLNVARLAARQGISLFDATFVELAIRSGLTLLTADARLVRAISGLVSTELLQGIAGSPQSA